MTGAVFFSHAQQTDSLAEKKGRQKKVRPQQRNVLWFSPTRAHQINGIALSGMSSDLVYKNDSLQVNGLRVEADPLTVIFLPYILIQSVQVPFANVDTTKRYSYRVPDTIGASKTFMNGINISLLGGSDMNSIKGINISSFATYAGDIKGISTSLLTNTTFDFKGILIAGLLNDTNKGSGLQVALFNRCKDCKGVQVGLLNKMGKRTLPIINMRFKRTR